MFQPTRVLQLLQPPRVYCKRAFTTSSLRRQSDTTRMALTWGEIHARKQLILSELFTIHTTTETISDGGVEFIVRVASALAKKPTGQGNTSKAPPADPFENPPSQKLFGGPITPTHSFVFNKFNLVEDHMVIVTNDFEPQMDPLTVRDLEAVWKCLVDLGGMAFFNGGRLAGASQPHKHMQFLPTPLAPGSGYDLPIESILNLMQTTSTTHQSGSQSSETSASTSHTAPRPKLHVGVHPSLPFYNLFAEIPDDLVASDDVPVLLHEAYLEMLRLSEPVYRRHQIDTPHCFNMLFMKRWILFVPRSKECVDDTSISINSMGFAGTMFVKSTEHLEIVKKIGPMGVLKALTLPTTTQSNL